MFLGNLAEMRLSIVNIAKLKLGRLAKSTLLVMFWQFVRLAALAAWVFLVAKWMGAANYGQFMGVAGLATTVSGLVGLGIGLLMYQSVSIDVGQFAERWRQTLFSYLVSGGLLAILFGLLATLMFDDLDFRLVVGLGLSEIIAFPLTGAAAFAFAAHDRMGWAAALPAITALLRALFSAAYFYTASEPSLAGYVKVHVAAALLASMLVVLSVRLLLKPETRKLAFTRGDLRQGVGFSGIWFTGNALSSWDKALALKIGGSELSGLYAITYRVAAVMAVPVDSLIMSVMPRLFRQGSGEVQHPKLVFWLCVAIGAYGSLIGSCLFFLADYIPVLLGDSFGPAAHALRWFGLFVLLYGFRQLSAQILVAQNQKRIRLAAEIVALLAMTVLSILLVPNMGLQGAVLSMLLIEGGLATVMWIMVLRSGPSIR